MNGNRALLVGLLSVAAVVAAQSPRGIESRQAYLSRELDRWAVSNSMWVAMLEDPHPAARAQALQVIASNVDPTRIPLANLYIGDSDPRVREQVMLAAGRLGPAGLNLALQGLRDRTPVVRQAAAWAACHGGSGAFEALTKLLLTERSRPVLESLLANLWRLGDAPWEAHVARYAGHTDVFLRRAAAYSLSRTGAASARAAQRRLASDVEPVIRATALRGLERGTLTEQDLEPVLVALEDTDWRVRAAACRVLAAHDALRVPADRARAVVSGFSSPHPQLAASAIAAAGRHPRVGATADLLALVDGDEPWLAAEALAAVARRDSVAAVEVARRWLGDPKQWKRRGAARAAFRLGGEIEALAAADPDPAVRLAWLEALGPEEARPRKQKLLGIVEGDPDVAVRAQALSLLRAVDGAPGVDRLLELYERWADDKMPDARAEAVIAAMAATDAGPRRAAILELGLADPNPAGAAMVSNGARRLGVEVALPAREARHGGQWYRDLSEWTKEPRWLDVVTDRGAFRIRLDLHSAPITSREIWDLAERGFYNGLDFHRVVPNFVVQGGDPRGDGWGGPDFALPDEPSLVPFDSWRVGIATSGPNTGGCQLFVTLMPADHLTGHYTNFGEVVAGREVLTQIRVGDHILKIRTVTGSEPPPLAPVNSPKAGEQRVPGGEEPGAFDTMVL